MQKSAQPISHLLPSPRSPDPRAAKVVCGSSASGQRERGVVAGASRPRAPTARNAQRPHRTTGAGRPRYHSERTALLRCFSRLSSFAWRSCAQPRYAVSCKRTLPSDCTRSRNAARRRLRSRTTFASGRSGGPLQNSILPRDFRVVHDCTRNLLLSVVCMPWRSSVIQSAVFLLYRGFVVNLVDVVSVESGVGYVGFCFVLCACGFVVFCFLCCAHFVLAFRCFFVMVRAYVRI